MLLAVFVLLPEVAAGQKLARVALAKEATVLLGGRLTARMPVGARVEQRRRSIMAAKQPVQEETRVVLDAGAERLVVMAYEVFANDGGDFDKGARADIARWSKGTKKPTPVFGVEKLTLPGLPAFAASPKSLDTSRGAIFTLGVYTRHPDGLVQYLAFYVNKAGVVDETGVRKLVRAIAETLRPGPRRLERKGGERALAGLSKNGGLRVTLPPGWAHTVTRGPDFLVHRLRRITPLGKPTQSVSVYLGGHPSYQHRQSRIEGLKVNEVKAPLLGAEVSWKRWTRPNKGGTAGATTVEAIVPAPGGKTRAHVFYTSAEPAALESLGALAATLKAAKPAAAP